MVKRALIFFAVLLVGVVSVNWVAITDLFRPEPNVVNLDSLEYSFAEDAGAAVARLSTRPLLVNAVADSDRSDTRLLLKTRFIMPVQAYMLFSTNVVEGQQLRLYCRAIGVGGMLDDKPILKECSLR